MLQYAETYDIAGLIAPCVFFIESVTEDTIFPLEVTRASVKSDLRNLKQDIVSTVKVHLNSLTMSYEKED